MKQINFENVNLLNSRVNLLSGNLLPIAIDNSRFSIIWRIYSVIVWLIELIHTIALIFGIILVPKEKALKDGTVGSVVILETSFMLLWLYSHKKLMKQIIQKMNDIFQNTDEIMKGIVKSALKPITMPFVIYGVTAFSTEPFSSQVLISSTILMTIGSVYLFLKKFGVDIYMIHLVLMLTVQYRYTAAKLTILCQDQNFQNKSPNKYSMKNRWIKKELRELCRHQNTVLNISFMLKKLLSINFSLLYINNVFRFCFIGILLSTVPSSTFAEGISIILFTLGSLTQFFLLCSSVQTLSDASTEMTDKAFNEGWYQFGSSNKRTFISLIMANNLECKIAAIGKFNLSLPSFMTIMNQSYSIALLFLRAK
ncbi:uncharacterized protein LOC105429183 isoform X2 [Pogonomyrmex barbatus]|uniref:Odorant receptor n=1 Tax=Pogonomyrmex barbatus TaxID=144034 RepID=A0A6I9WLC3_9HYME|nr:uncharacterized protein LOC105429183 isoform X2 [Pogonomyrmex barbatus]